MKKLIVVFSLFISSIAISHNPFHSPFFHHGMGDSFWRDFDRQFQNIDRDMRRLRLQSNSFSTQSRQYFDKDKNSYVIEIKASGLDKNDLDISTEKNMLIIKGSQKIEKTSKHSSLRTSSNFSHSVSIPVDGDGENISADFNNGILKVSIPKLDKPKPKSQKININ